MREIKRISCCNAVSFLCEFGRMGFCGLDTVFVSVFVFMLMLMWSGGWRMLNGRKLIQ